MTFEFWLYFAALKDAVRIVQNTEFQINTLYFETLFLNCLDHSFTVSSVQYIGLIIVTV